MLQDVLHEFGPSFGVLSIPDSSTLESMPEKNRSLWLSTTSSVPSLLDASQSWRGEAPRVRELVMDTLRTIESSDHANASHRSESQFCVNFQGEVDDTVNPRVVISQLVDADHNKTAFLTGLRLPIVDDLGFRVPPDICRLFEPFSESNNQVNLTPKYSFVDLHIDYGADGLSIPVGDCRKIWLLWPPTSSNLRALKTVDGQRGRLARLAPQLEGCVVVETTSAQAIHIPAASLHATFTLQGGFLVARDFTTSRSLMAISTILSNGLDENLPLEARTVLFEWFERCLDISITHRKITEAVSAWLRAETKLASWASSQRGWRVSVRLRCIEIN
ncbi:hypothetical protein N7492_006420 [Penicillium capsulatum]|uniref:JmjC domain-containing protein n=1 Tax=Penicillium capsulatum TaxID=69766 RepID=A0A9W9LKW0_9EURO|nr:hypothetical protein N7492_006420 [Penicillium capsulatum]KAJ6116260.1 hypothetical protein N7512_005985 [Penicillium capsulatum]